MFERLGAESKADTTSTAVTKVSQLNSSMLDIKRPFVTPISIPHTDPPAEQTLKFVLSVTHNPFLIQPTGVFSRLGGGQEDAGWRDGPKPAAADDDSDGEGSVLQYAGVLKRPHPSTKKEPSATKPATTKPASLTLSRLGKKLKVPPSESSPPLPSSTSTHEGAPKPSILQRLGKSPKSGFVSLSASAKPLHSDALPLASPKVSSSTSAAGPADCPSAQMDATVVSVFKRLGAKRT